MRFLLRYLELILSVLGVFVTFAVPLLLKTHRNQYWETTTYAALIVACLHGIIFWLVRRQQRTQCARLVRDIRAMLQDRVNNYLQVILLHSAAEAPDAATTRRLRDIDAAAAQISSLVSELNEEHLLRWRERYPAATR